MQVIGAQTTFVDEKQLRGGVASRQLSKFQKPASYVKCNNHCVSMWEERGGEGCSWREKGIHMEMVGMEGGIYGDIFGGLYGGDVYGDIFCGLYRGG